MTISIFSKAQITSRWAKRFQVFSLFFFLGLSPLTADQTIQGLPLNQTLSPGDIKPVVEQMLAIHIQYHKLSPKLFSKILNQYFEEFDPGHLYLLQSEVEAYSRVNETRLAQQAEAFQKGDYSLFDEMDRVIQKAIWRARQWRASQASLKEIKWDGEARPDTILQLQGQWKDLLAKQEAAGRISELETKEDEYLYVDGNNKALDDRWKNHYRTLHILKAFASSLDPHTAVYSKQEASRVMQALNPQAVGIGLLLVREKNNWLVHEIVADSPAAKSKLIMPGDQLLEINGQALKGDERDLELLKQPEGQKVKLVLDRKGQKVEVVLQVTALEPTGVDRLRHFDKVFDGGKRVGYIAMDSFYQGDNSSISSEADLFHAIEELKKTGPLNALVLDLRQNLGGYLGQAVKVVGLFITNGVVVISKYSDGSIHYYRDTDPSRAFTGPVVVLTSRMSASAAEIVAQSLQDYGVAVVVGDHNTFGKGSIQTHTFDEANASAYYKVTVGRYYTVSGKSTQLLGVPVDVVVPGPYDRIKIGEKYEPDPLQPDNVQPSFADTLSDVEAKDRLWMMQHYLSTLQSKSTKWQPVIPRLKEASQRRQDLFFQKKEMKECSDQELWDMQTNEALEIAKEMADYK